MSDAPQFVEFLESHRPPLTAGEYKISVTQDFSEEPLKRVGGGTWHFTVAGPQFSLSPQEIAAVFPPPGSLGDHSNVFPHVALHRSTLPWERSSDKKPRDKPADWTEAATPWLALLVYDEDDLEKKEIRVPAPDKSALTVATLEASDDASYHLPKDAAPGDTAVSAVDVKTTSLRTFVPTALECRLLCHVRRNILFTIPWTNGGEPTVADLHGSGRFPAEVGLSERATVTRTGDPRRWRLIDDKGERSFRLWENVSDKTLQVTNEDAAEYAFVIGNRLPRKGKTTTVHLISLEERFDGAELAASDKDYTRFVSLHQWRFSCESHEHTFQGLLLHLNQPATTGEAVSPSDKLSTLRLPPNQDGPTEIRLAAGFTLLPHQFRDGSQSYSWYRGPLAPGPTFIDTLPLPAESSDALLAYDKTSGLFYTGYAAAWELGRLLCLANSRISQALYQWKREDRRMRRQTEPEREEKLSQLPVDSPADPDRDLPPVVTDWLNSLRRLELVPFRYLVPDERMLPVESIRFFEIDRHWTDSLIDGAFSIGRVLEGDHKHDQTLDQEQSDELRHGHDPENRITGLLLRSAVVSGWPLLTVDGLSQASGQPELSHKRLRFDRLAPDILLCLFKGTPMRYEIHLPKETVHFGVEDKDDGSRNFSLPKKGRRLWESGGVVLEDGRLRLTKTRPTALDPAVFALGMVKGVPKVEFERPVTA